MTMDLQLIGTLAAAFLGWASILVGAFWRLLAIIRKVEEGVKDGDDALSRTIKDGDDVLHGRINRVREDTVHKSDLDKHMSQISEKFRELRHDQQEATKTTNARLDALLNAIANQGKGVGP